MDGNNNRHTKNECNVSAPTLRRTQERPTCIGWQNKHGTLPSEEESEELFGKRRLLIDIQARYDNLKRSGDRHKEAYVKIPRQSGHRRVARDLRQQNKKHNNGKLEYTPGLCQKQKAMHERRKKVRVIPTGTSLPVTLE